MINSQPALQTSNMIVFVAEQVDLTMAAIFAWSRDLPIIE